MSDYPFDDVITDLIRAAQNFATESEWGGSTRRAEKHMARTESDLLDAIAALQKSVKVAEAELAAERSARLDAEARLRDALVTHSTLDGEYPDVNVMALWAYANGSTFIGGYDGDDGGWFAQDDDGCFGNPVEVIWCELPDLEAMHAAHRASLEPTQEANED